MMTQEQWEALSAREKRVELYLKQKKLLDRFLENGAISQRQYDKSFGDLTEKMGMADYLKEAGEETGAQK